MARKHSVWRWRRQPKDKLTPMSHRSTQSQGPALAHLHQSAGHECISSVCRISGALVTTRAPSSTIISCDRCGSFKVDETRPDFIVLLEPPSKNESKWIVIEGKGRLSDPSHIGKQLQAGVDRIQNDPLFGRSTNSSRVIAVVIYDGKSRAAEISALKGRKVTYQGKRCLVIPIRSRAAIVLDELIT